MAESSWPTVAGSRVVTDDQWEAMCAAFHADGVIGTPMDTTTAFADSTGRQVKVRAGKYAAVGGHGWYSGTTDLILAIAANSSGSTRIDRVVLGLSRTTWAVTAYVLTGTPGSGTAPALTRGTKGSGSGIFEVSLAQVTVANGASTISAANCVQDAPFVPPGTILTTTTTRPSTMSGGTMFADTDNGQWHWHNGSVPAPVPGAVLRCTRITSGNLATSINSETTVYTTTISAGTFQAGQSYEVCAEATTTTGLASPGDLATGIRVKAAGTTIGADEFRWLRLQGYQARHTANSIYSASGTSAVTFTVTALPNWSSNVFDVLGSTAAPFLFVIRAIGPTSALLTA